MSKTGVNNTLSSKYVMENRNLSAPITRFIDDDSDTNDLDNDSDDDNILGQNYTFSTIKELNLPSTYHDRSLRSSNDDNNGTNSNHSSPNNTPQYRPTILTPFKNQPFGRSPNLHSIDHVNLNKSKKRINNINNNDNKIILHTSISSKKELYKTGDINEEKIYEPHNDEGNIIHQNDSNNLKTNSLDNNDDINSNKSHSLVPQRSNISDILSNKNKSVSFTDPPVGGIPTTPAFALLNNNNNINASKDNSDNINIPNPLLSTYVIIYLSNYNRECV